MQENPITTLVPERWESFGIPAGAEALALGDQAQGSVVNSIVRVVEVAFDFQENSNFPGRVLEKSTFVDQPDDTGFFTFVSGYSGSFTTADFKQFIERPVSQIQALVRYRDSSLTCQVRLTDGNSDDPVVIHVRAIVVFFR